MQNLFSYPLVVDELTPSVKNYSLQANEAQREYIAEVLKVGRVLSFAADINVKSDKKEHLVRVWGSARSELELTSVVSLENFTKVYEPEFELTFDTKLQPSDLREMEFKFDEDVPDLVVGGIIDLAAVAMEQIALVIDDFPRREGEVFLFESEFDEETTQQANPFNVLSALKK